MCPIKRQNVRFYALHQHVRPSSLGLSPDCRSISDSLDQISTNKVGESRSGMSFEPVLRVPGGQGPL